jgi:hypothetical protein
MNRLLQRRPCRDPLRGGIGPFTSATGARQTARRQGSHSRGLSRAAAFARFGSRQWWIHIPPPPFSSPIAEWISIVPRLDQP